MKKIPLILFLSLHSIISFAQISNLGFCNPDVKICSKGKFQIGFDNAGAIVFSDSICIPKGSTLSNYTILEIPIITTSGTISFVIEPGRPDDDIDFYIFEGNCDNPQLVRCMASGKSENLGGGGCLGNTGLNGESLDIFENEGCNEENDNFLLEISATAGQHYYVVVNNYKDSNDDEDNFDATIEFSGTAKFGNGIKIIEQPKSFSSCITDNKKLSLLIEG